MKASLGANARRPGYRLPLRHLPLFAADLLLGRRRSFVRDARLVLKANECHERRVDGLGHVPCIGPFILVMNHFSRRGLRPYHCAMAVNDAVARRRIGPRQSYICWAFTSEYVGLHIGPLPVPRSFLRWLFRRVALVYGFVIIPRREELMMGRAAALRALRRAAMRTPIGLTPEGLASSGKLVRPPAGSGLFLAKISRGDVPLLPVGLWEDDGALRIRFGPPFLLGILSDVPRAEQDRGARDRIMMSIGRLLPRGLHGEYAEALAAQGAATTRDTPSLQQGPTPQPGSGTLPPAAGDG
jgi:hypothetical protein